MRCLINKGHTRSHKRRINRLLNRVSWLSHSFLTGCPSAVACICVAWFREAVRFLVGSSCLMTLPHYPSDQDLTFIVCLCLSFCLSVCLPAWTSSQLPAQCLSHPLQLRNVICKLALLAGGEDPAASQWPTPFALGGPNLRHSQVCLPSCRLPWNPKKPFIFRGGLLFRDLFWVSCVILLCGVYEKVRIPDR